MGLGFLGWGVEGDPRTVVAPVTVHRGHRVEVRMLLPPSSKPGHSQGALVQLHPDAVAPARQRGGAAAGSKPEVETLCFL